ncbi:hypothetical protein GCM10011367_22050 [Marinicauda pacifica]|jgi:hypothetical protein|nr:MULTISPECIES: hypothetical protein [Marinicauda]GGE46837.1 hypothetical protein GCM10011367_22050 [Marinicauda pacifica]
MKRRVAQIVLASLAVITLTACVVIARDGGADFAPPSVSSDPG